MPLPLAAAAAVVAGPVALWKAYQAVVDEDFGTTEFPAWFRAELIKSHVRWHGSKCPKCGYRVHRSDLTVDHIFPLRWGGRTSRQNAQVLCFSCNSSKGARFGLGELIRGRTHLF